MAFLSSEDIESLCEFLYCDVSDKRLAPNNPYHKLLQKESQEETCLSELETHHFAPPTTFQATRKPISPQTLRQLTHLIRSYVNAPLMNFIADLLDDPRFESVCGWSSTSWSFEIRDAKTFSAMWSSRSGNKDVSYIKISRALKSFENFKLAGWPLLRKVGTCRGKAKQSTVYVFRFFYGYEGEMLPPLTPQDRPMFPVQQMQNGPYTKRNFY